MKDYHCSDSFDIKSYKKKVFDLRSDNSSVSPYSYVGSRFMNSYSGKMSKDTESTSSYTSFSNRSSKSSHMGKQTNVDWFKKRYASQAKEVYCKTR